MVTINRRAVMKKIKSRSCHARLASEIAVYRNFGRSPKGGLVTERSV